MKTACSLPVACGRPSCPTPTSATVCRLVEFGLGKRRRALCGRCGHCLPDRLSVYDIRPDLLEKRRQLLIDALERGTVFGVGKGHEKPQDHPVLDMDWSVTQVTRTHKDLARVQLGSSGSGNHFAEFGMLTLENDDEQLGLKAGKYVALLTHSGSRGTGSAVCQVYSGIAQAKLPAKYKDFGRLAWLDLDSEAGQEYWAAMNLMGEYAAANHEVIHRNVSKLLGERPVVHVENHHNFAWMESHHGKTVVVHRKGQLRLRRACSE